MDFKDYLKTMVESDASDLYFSCGAPASAKINGNLTPIEDNPLTAEQIRGIAYSVMNEDQRRDFEDKPEMNLAISEAGIGRFRVNIFRQRNSISLVIRNIKTEIPDWKLLGLPSILTDVIMEKRGLVLFVGATGSGKSTSLASLIDHRNRNDASHIITIEDPIEFVHSHKKSIVNQREVGLDTDCYEDALKNTLRQA
ncbi:MAG: ATPase, T2SS/T4P/T4SS family, partial [Gammaproteobacteria bacterium]